jgi:hypothetical protein
MACTLAARRALLAFALALVLSPATALPLPLTLDPAPWINRVFHPQPGTGSVYDEVQCYGLPYGGFGFLSHALSYYTAGCLIYGRKPLAPWSELKHSILDVILCSLSMVTTVTTSAFTIDSCRNSWPFLLIGVWKLTLSFSLNSVGILASLAARKRQKEKSDEIHIGTPLAGTISYWCGSVAGLVGVFDIVHRTFDSNRNVRITTGILIGLACLFLLFLFAVGVLLYRGKAKNRAERKENRDGGRTLMMMSPLGAIGVAVAVAVFYSDWTLAAVQNNWAGTPSDDFAYLYWIYFAAKRLPMFAL